MGILDIHGHFNFFWCFDHVNPRERNASLFFLKFFELGGSVFRQFVLKMLKFGCPEPEGMGSILDSTFLCLYPSGFLPVMQMEGGFLNDTTLTISSHSQKWAVFFGTVRTTFEF